MNALLTSGLLLATLVILGAGVAVLKVFGKDRLAQKNPRSQEWWESD